MTDNHPVLTPRDLAFWCVAIWGPGLLWRISPIVLLTATGLVVWLWTALRREAR